MTISNVKNSVNLKTTLGIRVKNIAKNIYVSIVNNFFLFSKFKIVERDIRNTIITFTPTVPITLLEIDENNIDKLKERESDRKIELFKSRINAKNYGLMVLVDNKVAGYAWALFKNEKSKMGINIKMNSDEAIIKDVLVYPEFRNNKIHKYFLSVLMQRLSENNINKVLAAYLESNIYSEKAALSNGFVIVAKVRLIKLFGIKIQFSMGI